MVHMGLHPWIAICLLCVALEEIQGSQKRSDERVGLAKYCFLLGRVVSSNWGSIIYIHPLQWCLKTTQINHAYMCNQYVTCQQGLHATDLAT